MEITVEPSKTYAVTTSGSCTVTDADGLELCTASSGSQAFFVATTPTVTVSDDGAKVSRATFNYALAALGLLGGGDKLPAGYTRVDFLESTGTQYIDTGFLSRDFLNSELNAYVALPQQSKSAYIGTYHAGGYSLQFWVDRINEKIGGVFFSTTSLSRANADFTKGFKVRLKKNFVSINGEEIKGEAPLIDEALIYATNDKFFLFGRYDFSTASAACYSVKTYFFQSQKNGTLQAEFLPALDPTGEPCMYDFVSKQAFRNAGTGQFIAGMTLSQVRGLRLPAGGGKLTLSLPHEASIDRLAQAALSAAVANGWELTLQYAEAEVPAGYRRLEFLESTGTQHIDTGVKLGSDSEVDSRYIAFNNGNETQTNYYLFASRAAYNKNAFEYMTFYRPTGLAIAYCGGDGTTARSRNITNTTTLNTVHNLKQNANYIKVDELVFSYPTDLTPFECLNNCLLGSKYGGATGANLVGRVYAFSIARAGEMQLDYVPCIAPNGALGMYNKVDGSMKENEGSGAFIAGLATVDDVRKLWLPETNGELTVSVPADTPDSAITQLRANNPSWQIAIQYRES